MNQTTASIVLWRHARHYKHRLVNALLCLLLICKLCCEDVEDADIACTNVFFCYLYPCHIIFYSNQTAGPIVDL